MSLSKPSREAGDFIRQLGLRTIHDIFEDMNREFEEAREENEARRHERRHEKQREAQRQCMAAGRAARTVEAMRNMEQRMREQAGPSTAAPVSFLLAEEQKTSK